MKWYRNSIIGSYIYSGKLVHLFVQYNSITCAEKPSWIIKFCIVCRRLRVWAFSWPPWGSHSPGQEPNACMGCCWFCPFIGWHLQKSLLTWTKLLWKSRGREAVLQIRRAKAMKDFVCDLSIHRNSLECRKPAGLIMILLTFTEKSYSLQQGLLPRKCA